MEFCQIPPALGGCSPEQSEEGKGDKGDKEGFGSPVGVGLLEVHGQHCTHRLRSSLLPETKNPYPFADRHCLLGHGLGVGYVVLHDGLEELVFILSLKGSLEQSKQSFSGISLIFEPLFADPQP